MTDRSPDAIPRLGLPERAGQILWFLWLTAVVALTVKILIWHLDYFKNPSPQFYRAALVLWPTVVLSSCVYVWLRRKTLWKFELVTLAVFAIIALLYYEPRATLACAALFLASYTLGNFAARKLRLALADPIERIIVGFGIGCGLLIPALFVLGLLKLFYPATFILLLLIPPLCLYRETAVCLGDLRALNIRWRTSNELRHPMVGIAIVFGFIAAVCSLMITLAPNITFDTLQMHFPSVQHYVRAHNISPIPEIEYSYFPQGGEVLWTLLYGLAGPPGAQVCSLLFFVWFLIGIFRLARVCGADRTAAMAGTIWVGTLPFLHWSGSVVKNDIMLASFQALALYGFSRWLNTRDFRWIVAGAFFVAQSFGIKHVAVFGGIPLAVLYLYAVWKQPTRWKSAALLVIVLVLFGTYWVARTYFLTGNPVYPENTKRAVSGFVLRRDSFLDRVGEYAKLPWSILFDGRSAFESPLPNPIGILLFAFVPLAVIQVRRHFVNGTWIACSVFVLMYFIYWASSLTTIRYAIVPIALLNMMASDAVIRFYNRQEYGASVLVKASLLGTEMYCLVIAVMGIMIIEVNGPQLKYFSQQLDKPGYLRSALRTYGSLEYLKGVAERNSAILGINNCSRAYAPEPLHFECILCPPAGCELKELAAKVKKDRPRYIIVSEQDVPASMIEQLNSHGPAVRMYHDQYFSVFQLGLSGVPSVP